MRIGFRNRLIEWQKTSLYGETRSVRLKKILQEDGTNEYIIEIRIRVIATVEGLSKVIDERVCFYTQAQSPSSQNRPDGDIYIFEGFEKTLTDNFFKTFNATVGEFMKQITLDGFHDLQ